MSLAERFKIAVRKGNAEEAKLCFNNYASRHGYESAKSLCSVQLMAEILKNPPMSRDEVLLFLLQQNTPSEKELDEALNERCRDFCAKNSLTKMYAMVKGKQIEQFASEKQFDENSIIQHFEDVIVAYNTALSHMPVGERPYSPVNLFDLESLQTVYQNSLYLIYMKPELSPLLIKEFPKLSTDRLTNEGIPLHAKTVVSMLNKIQNYHGDYHLNFFIHLLGKQDGFVNKVNLLNRLSKEYGKPLGFLFAELGVTNLINSEYLSKYFDLEEIREIAKEGKVEELTRQLPIILAETSVAGAPGGFNPINEKNLGFEVIFDDALLHALKNKQWQMATFLFARGAKVPTDKELGQDFMAFVEKNQIPSLIQTKRFHFYKKVLSNDPETLDLLCMPHHQEFGHVNANINGQDFLSKVIYADKYLYDKIEKEWLALFNKENRSKEEQDQFDEMSVRFFVMMGTQLVNGNINQQHIKEILGREELLPFIAETGSWMLLPHINLQKENITPAAIDGLVQTALISGYGKTALTFLQSFPEQARSINISAPALASALIHEDYETASHLINVYNADIDFSKLSMKEFEPFKQDLITWLQTTNDVEAKKLLEAPRIMQEVERRKALMPEKEAKSENVSEPAAQTSKARPIVHSPTRPLSPPQPSIHVPKENRGKSPQRK